MLYYLTGPPPVLPLHGQLIQIWGRVNKDVWRVKGFKPGAKLIAAPLHISYVNQARRSLSVFGTWIPRAGPVCMCMHATVRACLLVCLRYRQHSPDLASNKSRRRPKSSAVGGRRREVRRGGIGGIRRACICPGDSCNALCLFVLDMQRQSAGAWSSWAGGVAGSLRSPVLLLIRRSPSAESRSCCFSRLFRNPL